VTFEPPDQRGLHFQYVAHATALLGRHGGQLERRQRTTRFQQGLESAEDNRPATVAPFEALCVDARWVISPFVRAAHSFSGVVTM
jgi:hypothetical protein